MNPCYKVLEAESVDDLAEMVQTQIEKGLMPCGGVSVYDPRIPQHPREFRFVQAMLTPDALLPAAKWLAQDLQKELNPCPPKQTRKGK